jgi:Transposase IS116/IS110/IS902 family
MNPPTAESEEHHHRGFQLLSESSYPEARAQFIKAIEKKPDWASPHLGLGQTFFFQEKPDLALDPFPSAPQPYEMLASLLLHRSKEVRQDLVVLRARDALVAARTELINTTRGLVKSMGTRLPKSSSPSFAQKVEEAVPVEMREALLPLVRMTAALNDCIQGYDEKIENLGREKYGHTALLRQVKGVGPITALAYVLTLENPERFVKSRDVGPYLGLVPKQEDSGECQPQLGISKTGDTMLRKLLVGSAQYILGPFGPDTDLRR